MFLVLTAAVEVVLEVFRGILERLGITWAKGKVSLEEALKLAGEFAPNAADLNTKIQTVKCAAVQLKDRVIDKIESLDAIKAKLQGAGADVGAIDGELNAVATTVKSDLERSERQRMYALGCITALVGGFLAYQADFQVFRILVQALGAKEFLASLSGVQVACINVLVGG